MSSTSHYPAAPVAQAAEAHKVAVIVDNEPGCWARDRAVLRPWLQYQFAHGVGDRAPEHLSRITIVTRGTPMVIEQIKNQLNGWCRSIA